MKIICELGSNFKSFDDCKTAISLAKAVGADAIKFQLYTHKELYGIPGRTFDAGGVTKEASISMEGAMPREWIEKLALKAQAEQIEFLCTAFSVDGLHFIDPFVKTHKLASSEMCHLPMLRALKAIDKPTLVSTGAQTITDLIAVRNVLRGLDVTWLLCEAAYPSRHLDMRRIPVLREIVQADVGLSDHTTDIFNIPLLAKQHGCTVIEKHFNPFNYTDTPDAPHSINIEDFKAMVEVIRSDNIPTFGPTKDEEPMITTHKRRLVVTKDVAAGELLHQGVNYDVHRCKQPEHEAAHPFLTDVFDKLKAKCDLKAGQPLCGYHTDG